jgi:SEC-C motif domain protein
MEAIGACPCWSGLSFDACCGPYLKGEGAPSSCEALMRSRFSAFQLRRPEYILESWDLSTRPSHLGFDKDERRWSSLQIVHTIGGQADDERGVVEFKATYELGDDTYLFHEVSRFVRQRGQWAYLDATFPYHGKIAHQGKTLKNAPCPCGSGKKFKKCCGGKS